MMKSLGLEYPRAEPEILENEIQGLFHSKGACQSFWSLKAKVELSVFRDKEKGEIT